MCKDKSRKYSNFNPKIFGNFTRLSILYSLWFKIILNFFKVDLMVILLSAQLKTKVLAFDKHENAFCENHYIYIHVLVCWL